MRFKAIFLLFLVDDVFIGRVKLPEVQFTSVVLGDALTLDIGVLEFSSIRLDGAREDDGSGDAQHHHYDKVDDDSLEGTSLGSEGTVLPNDIAWLGGLLQFDFLPQKSVVVLVLFSYHLVVQACSCISLLRLHRGED